jgi:hypothetical protein
MFARFKVNCGWFSTGTGSYFGQRNCDVKSEIQKYLEVNGEKKCQIIFEDVRYPPMLKHKIYEGLAGVTRYEMTEINVANNINYEMERWYHKLPGAAGTAIVLGGATVLGKSAAKYFMDQISEQ